MIKFSRPFAVNPLSACIALAFPAWSGVAMAQPTLEASGAYSVGSSYDDSAPAVTGAFTLPVTSGAAIGRAEDVATSRWDSSAAVQATSSGDGHFGGASVTHESYGSQSLLSSNVKLVYSDTITNASATAQQATFTLNISSLEFAFDFGTRHGDNSVSFAASVYLDGATTPLWTSTFDYQNGVASYDLDPGIGTYTTTGTDIGLAAALPMYCGYNHNSTDCSFRSGSFGVSGYTTTLALGTVAAGESVGIRYEVDLSTETSMYGGDASAYFNDPAYGSSGASNASLAFDSTGGVAAAVPEPETYALMAAGLGLMAVARRRRNR